MQDVEDLCKRVLIINEGRLVFDGDLHHVNDVFRAVEGHQIAVVQPCSAKRRWRHMGG